MGPRIQSPKKQENERAKSEKDKEIKFENGDALESAPKK